MVSYFTKRNHYNPCFWTAFWNTEFFQAFLNGQEPAQTAREHEVLALTIRGDRIFRTKVKNIHYDKDLGVAEITPDGIRQFCQRWYPEKYDAISRDIDEHPESVFIDFEDILSAVERMDGYSSLLQAAKISGLSSDKHQGFLTCNLIMHAMRSHEMMTAMIDASSALGIPKWEYLWLLKNVWSNPLMLARAVTPLALAQWVFYRTPTSCFPLCDSPIMIEADSLMAILSPRLLLEINLNVSAAEDAWSVHDGISPNKHTEFQQRAIANTFKEIIFHDRDELERWRQSPAFRHRVKVLSDPTSSREAIKSAANRVMWALNGFGRVPPEFEGWVQHLF